MFRAWSPVCFPLSQCPRLIQVYMPVWLCPGSGWSSLPRYHTCNMLRLISTLCYISDVNECQTEANNCKYQCKNLIGTFLCTCPDGFRKVGMEDECVDVNECAERPGVCANGRCINTEGGYQCECQPGYVSSPDGTECTDNRRGICYQRALRGRSGLTSYLSSFMLYSVL